ncbi:metallophosphoesterase [Salipaludibacillus sp. CF4.18]|uniref:metallophosphoesterase n=1 Tax=Salipaludibacillus sp. CF4.18 TaxID=3373081 RepID=UPI003EE725C5
MIVFIIGLTVYTIWDNNRIIVVEETIYIDDLPADLEGFRIVQIADLHEEVFGEGQEKLIQSINQLEYDVAVFTGDMLSDEYSTNYEPTYSLLEGIENLNDALFVPGNTDPGGAFTGPTYALDKHEFIAGMGDKGVKKLDAVHTINRGNSKVHFVEFGLSLIDTSAELDKLSEVSDLNQEETYQKSLYEDLSVIEELTDKEILISLYHYPLADLRIDIHKNDPSVVFRDYDLHIAGHYHGGQLRIPILGALMVPESYYENNGLFPPRDRVSGFWEYDDLNQYVSRGLGSSNAIGFLNFRLFNTPEVNLLTLEKKP